MFDDVSIEKAKSKLKGKIEYTDKVKKFLLNNAIPIKEKFIIALSELSSQMYGPLLQKIVVSYLSLIEVRPSLNRGDAKSKDGRHFEIKTGMVNNGKIKLFQVRPYQDIEAELTFHYDPETDEIFCFYIPHQHIKHICSSIGSSSHGSGLFKNEEKQIEINTKNLQTFSIYKKTLEEIKLEIR